MPGWEHIGKEEQEEIKEIFEKGGGVLFRHSFDNLRNGVFKVKQFEQEFAQAFGVKYGRAVTSGTAALKVALVALGVKPGDEVITQSYTFVATAEAIIDIGAIPVFTDVNETLNMDSQDLEKKITSRTKVILPVHMMGGAAQLDEIMAIAQKHNLKVLEDTAQAIGGEYRGRKLGTIGDMGIFSFDFAKMMTTGEGGMVVTNDEKLYKMAKEYSDHGHEENPHVPRGEDTRTIIGFNYNMNELQGAVGLAQLRKLSKALEAQRENRLKLKGHVKNVSGMVIRESGDESGDAADVLVVFFDSEEKAHQCAAELKKIGGGPKLLPGAIQWHFAGTWDYMLRGMELYDGKKAEDLWPYSAALLKRAVAVPILMKMDDEKIKLIAEILKKSS